MKLKQIVSVFFVLFLTTAYVSAQVYQEKREAAAISVTAAATDKGVRFVANREAAQIKLEVFGITGSKLFDSEFVAGNVLDWKLAWGEGAMVLDGRYLCVVTVKDLNGRSARQHGKLQVENGGAAFLSVESASLSLAEEQLLKAFSSASPEREQSTPFLVLGGETPSLPILAHDGQSGNLIAPAWSFRTGDFLRARDTERVRITAEGNVGIGVAQPQAKLEVAGLIRTSEGIQFADGSILKSATATGKAVAAADEKFRLVRGEATLNYIPLWTDVSGQGNSPILESSRISQTATGINVAGVINSTGGIKFADGTVQTTAAFSNIGDITAVNAGTGLSGGGTTGDVTLNIAKESRQNKLSNFAIPILGQ